MGDFNSGKTSPRSSAVARRHANQIQRAVENLTQPVPAGVRVPSRLGPGSLPGSGNATPRMGSGTPRMGTPRSGFGRHGPFGSGGGARRRRRVLLNMIKLLLFLCFCYLVLRQVARVVRYRGRAGGLSDGSLGVPSPVVEDQVVQDLGAEDLGAIEDYTADEELDQRFQNIIGVHGMMSEEQRDKLQLLADVLLAEHRNVDISLFPGKSTSSGLFAHPTAGISGETKNHFYRFTNIKIEGGKILFYGGPAMRQPKRMWFDVTTTNSTSPKVPTTLLLRNKDGAGRQHLDIEYLAERSEGSATCKLWIEQPTFIVHTRYPDNMWHAWAEGYIATFQSAREMGYLALHSIDDRGVVTRLGSGLPGATCPTVADLLTGAVKPAIDCTHRDDVSRYPRAPTCNVEDMWCHPGVWPGNPGLEYSKDGPVVVYFDASTINAEWSSLYSAMASKVRSFDALEGYCIRNLIVGTTKSLKFEEKFEDRYRQTPQGADHVDSRVLEQVQAMESLSSDLEDFVQFTLSALERLRMNNAIEFLGYPNPLAEKMRQGLRFGQGSLIDKVYPAEQEALFDAYFSGLDMSMQRDVAAMVNHPWVFSYEKRHIALASEYDRIHSEAVARMSPSPLSYKRVRSYGEGVLPVVTFISRVRTLNRAVLNERQILRYIYWNYEVKLQVTDLTEGLDVIANSMASTDVLIGTHQPEWMHAIFLPPGAVSLQLHPYGWDVDGGLLRGGDVENIVHLRRGTHLDWVNPYPEFSFFRRKDFGSDGDFRPHPSESGSGPWARPSVETTHPAWLYANTYADMNHLRPYIDACMETAGIPKLPEWKIDELRAIRAQIRAQMPDGLREEWLRGNLFSTETATEDEEDDGDLGKEEEEEDALDEGQDMGGVDGEDDYTAGWLID